MYVKKFVILNIGIFVKLFEPIKELAVQEKST